MLPVKSKMITPNYLAEVVVKTVTGHEFRRPKVININEKHFATRGDLSFPLELDHWRGYVDIESEWFKNSKNVLQYFLQSQLCHQSPYLTNDQILEILKQHIVQEIEQSLSISNINSQILMEISHDFVLINFVRSTVSYFAIKKVFEDGLLYGRRESCNKKVKLTVEKDDESEITNMRLNLLQKVSINIIKSQGYDVQIEDCKDNYIFTIRSESCIQDNYNRYLCGAVLNASKKKEKNLTQQDYLERKIDKIKELNEQKCSDVYIDKNNVKKDMQKIANASIAYELLSSKHSSSVILENSDSLDRSIKEASFVLYNYARMTAILDKYANLVKDDEFPQIISLEEMESFNKITDQDSWQIIYNYIIKYPDILKIVVISEPKLEINIHVLWLFVSNLCHDFSKYYRRNRILMNGVDSNHEILNIATERLHMLRALRIVLRNSLLLLEVEEVTYM